MIILSEWMQERALCEEHKRSEALEMAKIEVAWLNQQEQDITGKRDNTWNAIWIGLGGVITYLSAFGTHLWAPYLLGSLPFCLLCLAAKRLHAEFVLAMARKRRKRVCAQFHFKNYDAESGASTLPWWKGLVNKADAALFFLVEVGTIITTTSLLRAAGNQPLAETLTCINGSLLVLTLYCMRPHKTHREETQWILFLSYVSAFKKAQSFAKHLTRPLEHVID